VCVFWLQRSILVYVRTFEGQCPSTWRTSIPMLTMHAGFDSRCHNLILDLGMRTKQNSKQGCKQHRTALDLCWWRKKRIQEWWLDSFSKRNLMRAETFSRSDLSHRRDNGFRCFHFAEVNTTHTLTKASIEKSLLLINHSSRSFLVCLPIYLLFFFVFFGLRSNFLNMTLQGVS
jgi:hypothetical protein